MPRVGHHEWEVEYTNEFGAWWDALTEAQQEAVAFGVHLIRQRGPMLGRPYSDTVHSALPNMKELRVQHRGRPIRVLYSFDPRRTAILLLGGDKTGDARWYDVHVPLAERLYEEHVIALRREGLIE